MSNQNYQDYIDDFDRTASGAGSSKGTDRFSGQDIRVMFSERGDLSKAEGAQMVLDYAKKAGRDGSKMGGAAEDALDKLRGYLDEKPEETETEPDEPTEFVNSPKVAHAKARLSQWKEDVLSGKTGDIWNKSQSSGNDAADSFLDRYKLKLGKQDEDGNYFQPN